MLDFDYSPGLAQPVRDEVAEQCVPVEVPESGPTLTPFYGTTTCDVDKDNIVVGKRGGRVPSLHASLASVHVSLMPPGGIGVNWEVFIPQMEEVQG